jgi:stress responsive alpha/beta barrel protein
VIDRVVILKLHPEHANPAGRAAIAERCLEVLRPLDGVLGVTVGVPADEASERSWDVSITVRFASMEDLEGYRANPVHRRFVDDWLSPRTEVKKAWNFTVQSR